MNKNNFISKVHKNLIVSCQALENEALHGSEIMAKMALAAKQGGAAAIRCNSVKDCSAIKEMTRLPIIGISKVDYPDSDVYITPTMTEVKDLLEIPPDVISLDATIHVRPNGEKLNHLVEFIHEHSDALVMGDIATEEDASYAINSGVDIISTTLSGYTEETKDKQGPDFLLVEQLLRTYTIPIIAEGKISTPQEAKKMLELGAWSVVVGGAITRPNAITQSFVNTINVEGDLNG